MSLEFPSLGSVRRLPVYKAPVRKSDETDERFAAREKLWHQTKDVQVEFLILGHETAVPLRYRRACLLHEYGGLEDAKPMPLEWIEAWRQVHLDIARACIVGVPGVSVGGKELRRDLPREDVVAMLEATGQVMVDAATVAVEGQGLTEDDVRFFESSLATSGAASSVPASPAELRS